MSDWFLKLPNLNLAKYWFVVAAMLLLPMQPSAAEDFYKGKTIRIIVGFGPGGGYQFYAQLLAHHLGAHIPGHPNIVVENMTGAGSITAANYVYNIAPKDGTVIASVDQTVPMHQLLGGSGAQFNSADLQWIGSLAHSNSILWTWAGSGVKTLEDAKRREVTLGGSAVAADTYIYPTIFNALLGTRFKIILGYQDGPNIDIAIERGEIAGNGAASWLSVLTNHKSWVDDKKLDVLLQTGLEKEHQLPEVPLLRDLVKDPATRPLSDLISISTSIGDAYWLAPGVPADRIDVLRVAFNEAVKDPALLADAARSNGEVRPQTGKEIAAQVAQIANTPQQVLDHTAKMLGLKK